MTPENEEYVSEDSLIEDFLLLAKLFRSHRIPIKGSTEDLVAKPKREYSHINRFQKGRLIINDIEDTPQKGERGDTNIHTGNKRTRKRNEIEHRPKRRRRESISDNRDERGDIDDESAEMRLISTLESTLTLAISLKKSKLSSLNSTLSSLTSSLPSLPMNLTCIQLPYTPPPKTTLEIYQCLLCRSLSDSVVSPCGHLSKLCTLCSMREGYPPRCPLSLYGDKGASAYMSSIHAPVSLINFKRVIPL